MSTITKIGKVSITDLRTDIANLVSLVCYGGERFVITSSGKERAALVSIDDLERLLALEWDEGESTVSTET